MRMTSLLTFLLLVPLTASLWAQTPPADAAKAKSPSAAEEAKAPRRGIVVSCPSYGPEWGSQDMWDTLDELKGHGVNAIQIHPYAGIRNDGRVRNRSFANPEKPPAWITRPIKEAQKRGLTFMMKPHLAYWGSKFSWRGEIAFGDDEEAWKRFFAGYESWIVKLAQMSQGADCFVVGTELDRTLHREKEWRQIIAAVRRVYPGRLTYAANWSDYTRVPFWDALDAVGIQAYFPLAKPTTPRADGSASPPPSRAALTKRWGEIRRELELYSRMTKKPIVFTELGYNCGEKVVTEPWDAKRGSKSWAPLQALCLEIALETIEASPALSGSYLWKWFPGRRQPRDFNVESPHLRKVLNQCWKRRAKPAAKDKAKAKSAPAKQSEESEEKDDA